MYGENKQKIKSGYFEIYEKSSGVSLYKDSIRFDDDQKTVFLKVNKLLKANREYIFRMNTNLPEAVELEVRRAIIKALIEVKRGMVSRGSATFRDVHLKLKAGYGNYAKYIKQGASIANEMQPLDSESVRFMDNVERADTALTRIRVSSADISNELDRFLDPAETNIARIKSISGRRIADSLLTLSGPNGQNERLLVARGSISFGKRTPALPVIDLATFDDKLIASYKKNLGTSTRILKKWLEQPAAFLPSDSILLLSIYNKMNSNLTTLNTIFDPSYFTDTDRQHHMQNSILNQFLSLFQGSSFGDFETHARRHITADIGVLGTKLNDQLDILPYVGMNISFVPINKNAPFKQLKEEYSFCGAVWRRTSLTLGITLSKMSSDMHRGIFDFANERGGIAGIGVRPLRGVKVSGGYLLYNKSTGNTLNPDQYKFAASPYYSISIDWDLKNLIPNIKSIF